MKDRDSQMLLRFTLTVKLCFFSKVTLIDWKFGRFDESVEIVSLPVLTNHVSMRKGLKENSISATEKEYEKRVENAW